MRCQVPIVQDDTRVNLWDVRRRLYKKFNNDPACLPLSLRMSFLNEDRKQFWVNWTRPYAPVHDGCVYIWDGRVTNIVIDSELAD